MKLRYNLEKQQERLPIFIFHEKLKLKLSNKWKQFDHKVNRTMIT